MDIERSIEESCEIQKYNKKRKILYSNIEYDNMIVGDLKEIQEKSKDLLKDAQLKEKEYLKNKKVIESLILKDDNKKYIDHDCSKINIEFIPKNIKRNDCIKINEIEYNVIDVSFSRDIKKTHILIVAKDSNSQKIELLFKDEILQIFFEFL